MLLLLSMLSQAGAKWYGQHLGMYKTPAKETDPRYMTPNFYYDMVDYCQEKVKTGWPSICSHHALFAIVILQCVDTRSCYSIHAFHSPLIGRPSHSSPT